jgi:hypothetical protein
MRAAKFFFLKAIMWSAALQICAVLTISAQEFQFSGNRKKDAISFSLTKNLVVIPVYVNGKGPYNFILDTGVGPMIITDTTIVKELDPTKLRPIKITGLGKGAEIEALLSNEISASVGKAGISYIPAAILKEDVLGLSNYVGINISGLLGYYFFRSFIVKINYSARRVVYFSHGTARKIKGEKVPIQILNSKPYVNIDLDVPDLGSISAKMVIDNGASHALSLETLNEKPFPVPTGAISANLGIGLNGPISGNLGRVTSVKLGNFVFKNVISSYPVYDDVALKTYLLNRNGNLGAEILSRFNITFDYEGGAMYLKPNMTFKRSFDHDMAGIEIYSEETKPRRFYASRIESGSPADLAGIREGDEILSVNFTKTSTMDLDDLSKLLRSGDGKVVFFSLNRSGELLIKMIKLKKRI